MKNHLSSSSLRKNGVVISFLFASLLTASAQGTFGTVYFNNRVVTPDIYAPVYDMTVGGTLLQGSSYSAQLYSGPLGTPESQLVPTGAIVNFKTGMSGGLVEVGSDGSRSIPNVAPGEMAVVQVRAWTATTGSTYELAMASSSPSSRAGKSNVLTLQTKVNPLDPAQTTLVGLQSFAIAPVPEPDVVWLGSIGLALLALRFRLGEDRQS
jgi:hypothetical protein